jgi:hypothetical protein
MIVIFISREKGSGIIPALQRLRQEDLKFKASLGKQTNKKSGVCYVLTLLLKSNLVKITWYSMVGKNP